MLTDYENTRWQGLWSETVIPAFAEETGVQVEPEYWVDLRTRFPQLIEGTDWPDVSTSSFAALCRLEAHRAVEPVTDLLDGVITQNGAMTVAPYARPPEETLQIPYGYQVETLLYREDVYDDLELDVPTSFAELQANARAIEESEVDIAGYQVTGSPTMSGLQQDQARREFQAYLARMGVPPSGLRYAGSDTSGDIEIHFPEEAVTTVLEYLRTLASLSAVSPEDQHRPTIYRWVDGQAAHIVHLNNWPAGIAGWTSFDEEAATYSGVAEHTGIAPLPYWRDGGVSRSDAWLGTPRLDAFHLFTPGENTTGARRWLEWLFADRFDRTAGLYRPAPTRYVPNYADVFDSETYRQNELFEAFPRLLDQIDYIHDTIRADHYGQRTEEVVDSPVGLYLKQQPFFAEMVYRAVTGEGTPTEAYEFGRARLEARLVEARERFPNVS